MIKEENILREEFLDNFNEKYIIKDLIELIDSIDLTGEVFNNYIKEQFNDNFMYGEIYDIFKKYFNKKDLKSFMEKLGHDFIDLDNLTYEEREKFY